MSKVTYNQNIWGGPLPDSFCKINSTANDGVDPTSIQLNSDGTIDVVGNSLTVGDPPQIVVDGAISKIQTIGDAFDWGMSCVSFDSDVSHSPGIAIARSDSDTVGTQAIVSNGDYLGSIWFYGSDGEDFKGAASIVVRVDGTPGAGDMPGRFVFSTTPDGNSAPVERMRIDSVGRVGIGMTPADPNTTGAGGTDRLSVCDPSVGSSYFSVATYDTGSGGGNANSVLSVNNYNNDGYGDGLDIIYSGGTASSPSHLASNTEHGLVNFKTWLTGTTYGALACVQAFIDGGPSTSTSCSGRLIFGTTPVGAVDTTERMRIDHNGNVIVNTAAIATNATDGFLYVPTCAGTPTGTPTTYTGRAPMVVDTTNNRLYFYSSGAWRNAGP